MQRLLPSAPSFQEEHLIQRPSHEWIAPSIERTIHYGVYKKLPAGKPDYLYVDTIHFQEGVERCTAAVYGERAYVIHYEFKAHPCSDGG